MLIKSCFYLVSLSILSSVASSLTLISAVGGVDYEIAPNSTFSSAASGNKDNHWGDSHSGRQTSGGPRDDCPSVDKALTALMPSNNWGIATTQTPTLWFYNPYSAEQINHGQFVLQNAQGFDVIDPIGFSLPETPGFISVTVPVSDLALESGTEYYWALELYCDSDNRTPIYVEGWIQPESPSLETTESLEEGELPAYQIYWENRIWFDAVNELAQLRLNQPLDEALETEWLRLLEDGGLDPESLVGESLVGPVSIQD